MNMSTADAIGQPELPPLSAETIEKCFQYVLSVPFPNGAVPVAIKTLHGSTCNDICQVTTRVHRSSTEATQSASSLPLHGVQKEATAEEDKGGENSTNTTVYFLKSSRGVKRSEILLEAGGLELLRSAGLPVPPIILAGEIDETAFLVEPFIDSGKGRIPSRHLTRDEAAAGRALAHLHRCCSPDGRFGCRRVAASLNIGDVSAPPALASCFSAPSISDTIPTSTTTSTTAAAAAADAYLSTFVWSDSWPELYVRHLLEPQVSRAQQRGLWSASRQQMFDLFTERLRAHFETRVALAAESDVDSTDENQTSSSSTSQSNSPCRPHREDGEAMTPSTNAADPTTVAAVGIPECSLLHGDIWGGNLLFDAEGRPLFIDPQPLFGDREMDIAMTQFFGGFGEKFYAAYEEDYPLPEDADMRVPWYQLYYLLMHLNLFGEAYGRATEQALQSV